MLKTTIIIFYLLLLVQINSFGQRLNPKTKTIDKYTYHLDTITTSTDTITFLIDSIQITAQVQKNRIIAKCLFMQSKSNLTINFYSKDNYLVAIKASEQSPNFSDLHTNSFFYYDRDKLFDENYNRTVRICMAIDFNKSMYEIWGYNPNLNSDFLKRFVWVVYYKIKQQPTFSFLQLN